MSPYLLYIYREGRKKNVSLYIELIVRMHHGNKCSPCHLALAAHLVRRLPKLPPKRRGDVATGLMWNVIE
jgi:hypothetical protein